MIEVTAQSKFGTSDACHLLCGNKAWDPEGCRIICATSKALNLEGWCLLCCTFQVLSNSKGKGICPSLTALLGKSSVVSKSTTMAFMWSLKDELYLTLKHRCNHLKRGIAWMPHIIVVSGSSFRSLHYFYLFHDNSGGISDNK